MTCLLLICGCSSVGETTSASDAAAGDRLASISFNRYVRGERVPLLDYDQEPSFRAARESLVILRQQLWQSGYFENGRKAYTLTLVDDRYSPAEAMVVVFVEREVPVSNVEATAIFLSDFDSPTDALVKMFHQACESRSIAAAPPEVWRNHSQERLASFISIESRDARDAVLLEDLASQANRPLDSGVAALNNIVDVLLQKHKQLPLDDYLGMLLTVAALGER